MLNRIFAIGLLLLCSGVAPGQKKSLTFDHVEPPFWWTGMKNPTLQIMFHKRNADLRSFKVTTAYPGVSITEVKTVENPHYLFVTIDIVRDIAGTIPFTFSDGKKSYKISYPLREKAASAGRAQGFNSSDVIYLIMPDRFANGDFKNDSISGMFEGVNRSKPGARHGGDLKGVRDRLSYLHDLGVTSLWLNPVLENNQKAASYHGYAITDLYQVDRRFGGNDEYLTLINDCHANGMKVIQDMVMNHIGDQHWLMQDLPEKDWIHQFPEFTRSNYRSTVVSDPYQSKADAKLMNDGWFDTTMPDINQQNQLFGTYLIQNTLWWIEYAGIDGIRMDTYPYPDKNFMAKWCKAVFDAYPSFNVVGEVWVDDVATTAYWQKDIANRDGYNSLLPSVTDFPLFFTLSRALAEEGGWDTGLARVYNLLARDFAYPDAASNVIFLDNHDLSRFFLLCGKDIKKFKMAIGFLLTTRGIPQFYYGTELLMAGDGGFHPNVRLDFPGGWPDDKTNAFSPEGRSAEQNDIHAYMTKIMNWRMKAKAIHDGKLTHYIPEDNVYVYFRSTNEKVVMVVMNGNKDAKVLRTTRFAENIGVHQKGRDIVTGEIQDISQLELPPLTTSIFELE